MVEITIFNNFYFIIADIIIGSLMAFLGILTFGKTKKIIYLFFIISAFILYLIMILRVLSGLDIFNISEYTFNNIPIFEYILNYLPMIFLCIGFFLILFERKD